MRLINMGAIFVVPKDEYVMGQNLIHCPGCGEPTDRRFECWSCGEEPNEESTDHASPGELQPVPTQE